MNYKDPELGYYWMQLCYVPLGKTEVVWGQPEIVRIAEMVYRRKNTIRVVSAFWSEDLSVFARRPERNRFEKVAPHPSWWSET